ncbi:MAG TPA: hypothetical protein VJ654_03030 [Noviherbaspirillum sp.]|nr:hypothetical protein [Noviherbaspirillum sp.]
MAYYQLEPFGEQIADLRHGVATSVMANAHRDVKSRPEPYKAEEFIYWHDAVPSEEGEPVLLDDPVAQGNLMRAALFGKAPKQ